MALPVGVMAPSMSSASSTYSWRSASHREACGEQQRVHYQRAAAVGGGEEEQHKSIVLLHISGWAH
jgi:hypothetical protein